MHSIRSWGISHNQCKLLRCWQWLAKMVEKSTQYCGTGRMTDMTVVSYLSWENSRNIANLKKTFLLKGINSKTNAGKWWVVWTIQNDNVQAIRGFVSLTRSPRTKFWETDLSSEFTTRRYVNGYCARIIWTTIKTDEICRAAESMTEQMRIVG